MRLHRNICKGGSEYFAPGVLVGIYFLPHARHNLRRQCADHYSHTLICCIPIPYLTHVLLESVTRRCLRVEIFAAGHRGAVLHNYNALPPTPARLPQLFPILILVMPDRPSRMCPFVADCGLVDSWLCKPVGLEELDLGTILWSHDKLGLDKDRTSYFRLLSQQHPQVTLDVLKPSSNAKPAEIRSRN